MSGHSKWHNIKRQKEAKDRVRGSIFAKLARAITLAVIQGGGITDPENNAKLRLAIDKAKSYNLPKENINRAIERGVGPDRANLVDLQYEAFAPGGVALYIVAASDNPQRTTSEIKYLLDRHGGKLGAPGSVTYLFKQCIFLRCSKKLYNEEEILHIAAELVVEDITENEDEYQLFVSLANIKNILPIIERYKLNGNYEIIFRPLSPIQPSSSEMAEQVRELIVSLQNLDDVQAVFSNLGGIKV